MVNYSYRIEEVFKVIEFEVYRYYYRPRGQTKREFVAKFSSEAEAEDYIKSLTENENKEI